MHPPDLADGFLVCCDRLRHIDFFESATLDKPIACARFRRRLAAIRQSDRIARWRSFKRQQILPVIRAPAARAVRDYHVVTLGIDANTAQRSIPRQLLAQPQQRARDPARRYTGFGQVMRGA
jgi:hypothetical protein